MNILLDTHILMCALASPKKLRNAVAAIHQEHVETLRIKELISTSQLDND